MFFVQKLGAEADYEFCIVSGSVTLIYLYIIIIKYLPMHVKYRYASHGRAKEDFSIPLSYYRTFFSSIHLIQILIDSSIEFFLFSV